MRPPHRRALLAALGTGVLLLAGCGDDDTAGPEPTGEPSPAATGTDSPTTTPSPAGGEPQRETASPVPPRTPTATATASPGGTVDGTAQTFIVAPQEPRDVAVGTRAEFSVGATYDGGEVPDRLWLGIVPCENYDLEAQTFTSTDGTVEGFDEDFGPRIYDVNGERYENVDDVWPTEVHVQSGVLSFSLLSEEQACGIPTVFQDTNDNGELDVDGDGVAVEPYGIGKASWS